MTLWSELKIESYEKRLITLNTNPKNQWVGDASVIRDGCRRIITVAGDNAYSDTSIADAAYVIVREAGGTYTIPKTPALFYNPPVSGVAVDYLGTGMGSCKAKGMFYGVFVVADMVAGTSWLALATSGDGTKWYFVGNDGLTQEPQKSKHVALDGPLEAKQGLFRLWHTVMEYDPNNDVFHIVVGFAEASGRISATWLDMKYGIWQPQMVGAIIPDAIDPMCIKMVPRDGKRESVIFMYSTDFTGKITYRVDHLDGVATVPQVLDLSPVLNDGWVAPCATRNAPHSIGLELEQWKNGKPEFIGYLAMGTKDMCSNAGQTDFLSSNGLVPLKIVGV